MKKNSIWEVSRAAILILCLTAYLTQSTLKTLQVYAGGDDGKRYQWTTPTQVL